MKYFNVWVDGRAKFDTSEKAEAILRFIAEHAPVKPDLCGVYEPFRTPFSLSNLLPAIGMLVNKEKQRLTPDMPSGDIFLVHKKKPRCTYRIEWSRGPHTPFGKSSCYVEAAYVRDPKHLTGWLAFCFKLLELLDAWYAQFFLDEELEHKDVVIWQTPPRPGFPEGIQREEFVSRPWIHEDGLPGVYWGNYLGPFYVDWFGREKFETLPCVHKQWLDTGGIFFTIAPTPFDWNNPAAKQLEREVRQHLGADAFFDIEPVRARIEELRQSMGGFLPDNFDLRTLVPPCRKPEFPFVDELRPKAKTQEEEIAEARRYFEHFGFTFEGMEGNSMIFRDAKGEVTKVNVGPGGKVEHWPKV
ncbi:MAG: hypothetical protein AB1522_04485 [Chloroflexota bacterium]